MTMLTDYHHFTGRSYEAGAVHNALAYQGARAPHTDEPYSEALLKGIAGGVALGYFTFEYEGFGSILTLLTRNIFDPLTMLLDALNIQYRRKRTGNTKTAVNNIHAALEQGLPPLVWADTFSLPYNAEQRHAEHWSMLPIVVYGMAPDRVHIADRAAVGLEVTPAALADARYRAVTTMHEIMTVRDPNPARLVTAVENGIRFCVRLYESQVPRGRDEHFGFKAYEKWTVLLRAAHAESWRKQFASGRALMVALTSAWHSINREGAGGSADRGQYAAFLDEAAVILNNNALNEAAELFRQSAQAWSAFSAALLPDTVPQLAAVRQLLEAVHDQFINGGHTTTAARLQAKAEISAHLDALDADFPLDMEARRDFFDALAGQLVMIKTLEAQAVGILKTV